MSGVAATIGLTRDRPVFQSPAQIVAAGLLSAFLVGVLLANELQLGIALLAGVLYLPVALLNLPLAIALWVPIAYLEVWPPVRFIPAGVAILLGLAWLATLADHRLARDVLRRHRGAFLLLLVFLAWITLSVTWADDSSLAARGLYDWYWAGAIPLVVATTLSSRRDLGIISIAFVAGALISVAVALPQLSVDPSASYEEGRLGGSVHNPNFLAAGLLSGAVLAVGLIVVAQRPSHRRLLIAGLAVTALAIFATGSRGGLIAAAVAVVSAFALMRGHRLRLGAILAVALTIGGLWVAASSRTLDRLREFDTTGVGRVDLWTVAGRMWEDHPILGVGFLNFPAESRLYLAEPGAVSADFIVEEPKGTHNAYLGLLAETGAVGLALFVAVVIAFMRATWQGVRRLELVGDFRSAALGRAILIAQIGPLVALLFGIGPTSHPLWILLALGPVLVTIAVRQGAGHPT